MAEKVSDILGPHETGSLAWDVAVAVDIARETREEMGRPCTVHDVARVLGSLARRIQRREGRKESRDVR